MKKTFKTTFVLLFLGLIPMSCNWNDCEGEPDYKNYHIISFTVNTTDLYELSVDTSMYLDFDSVVKLIRIDKTRDEVNNKKWDINIFSQSAYACDPVLPEPLEKIKEITIVSKSEFKMNGEDSVSLGDTITQLFLWKDGNTSVFENFTPFVKPQYVDKYKGLHLRLKNGFSKNTDCKFDIKIELTDNSIHEFKDEVLKVE